MGGSWCDMRMPNGLLDILKILVKTMTDSITINYKKLKRPQDPIQLCPNTYMYCTFFLQNVDCRDHIHLLEGRIIDSFLFMRWWWFFIQNEWFEWTIVAIYFPCDFSLSSTAFTSAPHGGMPGTSWVMLDRLEGGSNWIGRFDKPALLFSVLLEMLLPSAEFPMAECFGDATVNVWLAWCLL